MSENFPSRRTVFAELILNDHIRRCHAVVPTEKHPKLADHNDPCQSGDKGPSVGERRVCTRKRSWPGTIGPSRKNKAGHFDDAQEKALR